MEAIGLLVTLEARRGKEADAEAFLKSAQPLALDEKRNFEMVCDQARAREIRHLRHLCQRREPQRPLEWPDCEGIGGASQRIAGGSPASRKCGGPCKHPVKGLSARFQVSKQ